jgi:hypothetical protein
MATRLEMDAERVERRAERAARAGNPALAARLAEEARSRRLAARVLRAGPGGMGAVFGPAPWTL